MYEHSDLVHKSFPGEGLNQTMLAGDVVPFAGAKKASSETNKANSDAAKKGGSGYDPTNVDFGLLDKLGK